MILTDEKGLNILELSICRVVNIFLQNHGAAEKQICATGGRGLGSGRYAVAGHSAGG